MDTLARRILVAVDPPVLAGALAGVLGAGGDDVDVVDVAGSIAQGRGHYDIAVVTALATTLDADLVIELPDTHGGAGTGRVTSRSSSEVIELNGIEDVLGLLIR